MERKTHPSETKKSFITKPEKTKIDWVKFLDYVNSYDPKLLGGDNYITIQEDMIYGLGICSDKDFQFAKGYRDFKDILMKRWNHSK